MPQEAALRAPPTLLGSNYFTEGASKMHKLMGLLLSGLMVGSLAVVTAAPVAAHHDDEFTFFDVYRAIEQGMQAKNAGGAKQFRKGKAILYNIRGWKEHEDGKLPRWINRRCHSDTRDMLRDGYRYGVALKALGQGKATNWQYIRGFSKLRAKVIAQSRVRSTYRALEDSMEAWEDCLADFRVPRRFEIS